MFRCELTIYIRIDKQTGYEDGYATRRIDLPFVPTAGLFLDLVDGLVDDECNERLDELLIEDVTWKHGPGYFAVRIDPIIWTEEDLEEDEMEEDERHPANVAERVLGSEWAFHHMQPFESLTDA